MITEFLAMFILPLVNILKHEDESGLQKRMQKKRRNDDRHD